MNQAAGKVGLLSSLHNLYGRWVYWSDFQLRSLNAQFRKQGAPDGLPLPPASLVYLVSGRHNIREFYDEGVLAAKCIRDVLGRHGLEIRTFRSILDFGCGCGRILRQWSSLAPGTRLAAVDYNPRLVNWCRANLPFADFGTNELTPPLGFADGTFDFIYAISVFTHLPPTLQDSWLAELVRVLKSGGYLLFSVNGSTRDAGLGLIPEGIEQKFEAGDLVTVHNGYPGTNVCAAFHPEEYVRTHMAKNLNLIDFVPGGVYQDVVLLQKPEKAQRADGRHDG